jgi:hypothetical protein
MFKVGRRQMVLITTTILSSWLGVQAVHELGHVAGAWITGGGVAKVVLSPLTISRTDLADNPYPLIVVWAGPIIGSLLPLGPWALFTFAASRKHSCCVSLPDFAWLLTACTLALVPSTEWAIVATCYATVPRPGNCGYSER